MTENEGIREKNAVQQSRKPADNNEPELKSD